MTDDSNSDYLERDASAQDGSPLYRFLFMIGDDEYRYSSASYFSADSNETWEPAPIRATSITQTDELAKNGVEITLPRTNALAKRFLGRVPERATSLTIYRGHNPGDFGDFRVYWKGRVSSASVDGSTVTLTCEDIFTSMRRPGLRARYQKSCRHALYSTACGVTDTDYKVSATIIDETGFQIQISGIADSLGTPDSVGSGGSDSTGLIPDVFPDGYFTGGVAELVDGSRRYIMNHNDDVITLMQPFDTVDVDSVSVPVFLYPGCNHTTDDCANKFSNIQNYGGFPWLPSENPFRHSLTGSIT